MSLKYITVKEVLYNLPIEELDSLKEEIKNIKKNRVILAKENYINKVNELLPWKEGRDWYISYPEEIYSDLFIHWNNSYKGIHNGKGYRYNLRMKFNDKTVEIFRSAICICFSPYVCSNNCYVPNCCIVKYDLETKECQPYPNLDNTLSDWYPNVLKIYEPLFKNFKTLHDIYFNL